MSKSRLILMSPPTGKCEHGNKAITVRGCAYCATRAMDMLNLSRVFGCTASEISVLLADQFKTRRNLRKAVDAAMKRQAVLAMNKANRGGAQ